MRRIAAAAVMLLLPAAAATAEPDSLCLTGRITYDFADLPPELAGGSWEQSGRYFAVEETGNGSERKSEWLAVGLSAVLPGAGQFYTEAPLWRTLLYSTVEAASWSMYFIFDAKGEEATRSFEQYADRHWDVTRYVAWIEENYTGWSDEEIDKQEARAALQGIYRSEDPSLPPWERINFNQLNRLENAVGSGFSHALPAHGDQQYYEQIGKYIQYRAGWDDHNFEADTAVFDPSYVTTRNKEYVDMRAEANDLAGYAGTAVSIVLLNHVVSMLDAYLEARGYNARIAAEVHGELLPDRRYVPALGLHMRVGF